MNKNKVMLGMSGGVDSSVAAAVLIREGYEVIGVTMNVWPELQKNDRDKEEGCCSLSSVEDARKVANMLNIPYYLLNFKDAFEKNVIDYFKHEYLAGRTPNPCIACNRYIKFDALLNKALSMGIDYIATGHYAVIEYNENLGRYLLKKSMSDKKDQTYVLYNLTQEQLSKTIMPIGYFEKKQIRDMASELGLNIANKPDSQEICFVKDNNYGRFISENTDAEISDGYFVDTEGNILGHHKGIIYYTIGQRKGLGIAFGKPMYVVDIDAENNRVVLGTENEIFSKELTAVDLNFISIDKVEDELKVKAKIRYNAKESDATLIPVNKEKIKVVFDKPQRAVTPGQSVVFYDGDVVVGGGLIENSIRV